jgi:hypothetical protein
MDTHPVTPQSAMPPATGRDYTMWAVAGVVGAALIAGATMWSNGSFSTVDALRAPNTTGQSAVVPIPPTPAANSVDLTSPASPKVVE